MSGAVLSARSYAERWIERDAGGNTRDSLERLARQAKLSPWTVQHIWTRRAKTVSADVMASLKEAYLRLCERQLTALENEIAIEKARRGDVVDQDIMDEVLALRARLQAQKGK